MNKPKYWNNNNARFIKHKKSSESPNIASKKRRRVKNKHDSAESSGWQIYLPLENFSESGAINHKVCLLKSYLMNKTVKIKLDDIREKQYLNVDYSLLIENEELLSEWPDIQNFIKENPESFIAYLSVAIHQILEDNNKINMDSLVEEGNLSVSDVALPSVPLVHPRLVNYEPVLQLKHLKANYYGKFVGVKGTVVRVGPVRPLCMKMGFVCAICSAHQQILQPDGKYKTPSSCSNPECNSRSFTPDRNSSTNIDWQIIRLQEMVVEDHKDGGRIPRNIDCDLSYDLVDSCVPGDIITVCGIVKVHNVDETSKRHSNDKCLYSMYIKVNSLTNAKGGCSDSHQIGIEFSVKDLYAIKAIQAEPNLLKLLVSSLCPSIYGHELVKMGLLLGLFGGCTKYALDKNRIPIRGDPHILVVGDPGLGKSQMLQSCVNVAPRGVYVCGNTTTVSGLTVTLGKESGGSDYALEAGALVLADQGCCCIDEFDKMTTQHQALLEAMEQQSISIAKAGILCSLPSRTSILAAANPVGGHYNQAKTVSENLKIGSALLSRFDLVFILLDKPDEDLDTRLSEHVLSIHTRKERSCTPSSNSFTSCYSFSNIESGLSEQLKVKQGEILDLIPHQLIRKYIAYARKYVQPHLLPSAAQVLQKFYLGLRKHQSTFNCAPITTRQLESLIRLSEARAKIELREEVTEKDAEEVVELMKSSFLDTYSTDVGMLDFSRSSHGSGMSKQSQTKKFVAVLQAHSNQLCKSLFTVEEMKTIAKSMNMTIINFGEFLDSLNNHGYILKKGPKLFQLQTSDH